MTQDYLGNPISTADAGIVTAVDAFTAAMLAYETGAARVIKAAAASDAPLLNAYAAALMMMSETTKSVGRAGPFLAKAEAAAGANARERALTGFVRAWVGGDLGGAMAIASDGLAQWPRDMILLKLHDYLAFNAGDFPAMLRTCLAAAAACHDVPQAHGMLAFAYEECHLMAPAEASARRALSMTEREPWAQHALAHVMLMQGRIDEGADFLTAAAPGWSGLNTFMSGHNWWHLALFALSQGRDDAVLAAYDQQCWAGDRDYSQDQINAVSLLARLELAGIDVGARWADVGDHLAARGPDVEQPFLALQYLYGLVRAGRPEAAALLDAIRRQDVESNAFTRPVWEGCAIPFAEGVVALKAGDPRRALEWFDRGLPTLDRLGGSHAQRDLFHQIRLAALLADGRLTEAQQVLEQRRAYDPDGVPLNRALSDVYARLGLPTQAAEAAARVRGRATANA